MSMSLLGRALLALALSLGGAAGANVTAGDACTYSPGIDYNGGDLQGEFSSGNYALYFDDDRTYVDCCNECAGRPDCKAFTYDSPPAVCYLKAKTGWTPMTSDGKTSGLVNGR